MPTAKRDFSRTKLLDITGWTFGIEHEFSDWDTTVPLPRGFKRSPDHTIVNSNGIAAQPNPKSYRYGGEINTPASSSGLMQVEFLEKLLKQYPNITVNHRSNLHVHVRVPGLRVSLQALKQVQRAIHHELPAVIDLIEPIPPGTTAPERKRARRRKVSHHTFLTEQRLNKQLGARTLQDFFEWEVPQSKTGKPLWHAQPRVCVNLRQLLQTDTVEFRHFPGTLKSQELLVCMFWCAEFLQAALEGEPIKALWERSFSRAAFPKFPEFNLDLEVGYQATAMSNGLSQEEVRQNIALILQGQFHGSEAERKAQKRAGCLSR